MTTEKLLPHEELLIEISRTCRRLGRPVPITEFINAAYDLLENSAENIIRSGAYTARDVLHMANPHSGPSVYWKHTHPGQKINEELASYCCKSLRKMNAGEIRWKDGITEEQKKQYYDNIEQCGLTAEILASGKPSILPPESPSLGTSST